MESPAQFEKASPREWLLGWLRFWWYCLSWAFRRWDTVSGRLVSILSVAFAIGGFAGVWQSIQANHAWWLLLALPIVFIMVFVAPYHRYRTLATEVRQLEQALAVRQRDEVLADELQKEWSFGLHELVNGDVSSPKKFGWWEGERQEWEKRVKGIMEKRGCTAQELSHVFELHKVTTNLLRAPQVPEINHAVNVVSTRLDRIKDIISDYTT